MHLSDLAGLSTKMRKVNKCKCWTKRQGLHRRVYKVLYCYVPKKITALIEIDNLVDLPKKIFKLY